MVWTIMPPVPFLQYLANLVSVLLCRVYLILSLETVLRWLSDEVGRKISVTKHLASSLLSAPWFGTFSMYWEWRFSLPGATYCINVLVNMRLKHEFTKSKTPKFWACYWLLSRTSSAWLCFRLSVILLFMVVDNCIHSKKHRQAIQMCAMYWDSEIWCSCKPCISTAPS